MDSFTSRAVGQFTVRTGRNGSVHLTLARGGLNGLIDQIERQTHLIQTELLEHGLQLMVNQRIELARQAAVVVGEAGKIDRLTVKLPIDDLQDQFDLEQGPILAVRLSGAATQKLRRDLILARTLVARHFPRRELEFDLGIELLVSGNDFLQVRVQSRDLSMGQNEMIEQIHRLPRGGYSLFMEATDRRLKQERPRSARAFQADQAECAALTEV